MQLRIFQRKRREVHLQQTSAADEAMSKILGLQRENAVPEMETRQCKLFAEERESLHTADAVDPDFKKLYLSLDAQKASRDAMSQALIFMRTDRAPLVLIKKIADNSTL
ncbi:hypothetical protein ACET3Z_008887 [Daucus carota]